LLAESYPAEKVVALHRSHVDPRPPAHVQTRAQAWPAGAKRDAGKRPPLDAPLSATSTESAVHRLLAGPQTSPRRPAAEPGEYDWLDDYLVATTTIETKNDRLAVDGNRIGKTHQSY
jgi:hypothetical protein